MTNQRFTLWRRWQELRLIGQDPVLAAGLLAVGAFVLLFIVYPLVRVIYQGFLPLKRVRPGPLICNILPAILTPNIATIIGACCAIHS